MNIFENIIAALSSSDNNNCHIDIRYVIAFSAIMSGKNFPWCVFNKTLTGICFVLFCFFFLLMKAYLSVQMANRGKSWQ